MTVSLTWRLLAGQDPRWWVRWPDFGLPLDRDHALQTLRAAHDALPDERVEVTCGGGVGRTGTGLAALAVLDSVDPGQAVRLVRDTYHPRAVETPWQRRFVTTVAVRGVG